MKMKKQPKTSYKYIEKNIYKTGDSYRVRVGGFSHNTPNLKIARKVRSLFKTSNSGDKLW